MYFIIIKYAKYSLKYWRISLQLSLFKVKMVEIKVFWLNLSKTIAWKVVLKGSIIETYNNLARHCSSWIIRSVFWFQAWLQLQNKRNIKMGYEKLKWISEKFWYLLRIINKRFNKTKRIFFAGIIIIFRRPSCNATFCSLCDLLSTSCSRSLSFN